MDSSFSRGLHFEAWQQACNPNPAKPCPHNVNPQAGGPLESGSFKPAQLHNESPRLPSEIRRYTPAQRHKSSEDSSFRQTLRLWTLSLGCKTCTKMCNTLEGIPERQDGWSSLQNIALRDLQVLRFSPRQPETSELHTHTSISR